MRLAELATRLKKMDELTQQRLINWGYAVCDAGRRGLGDGGFIYFTSTTVLHSIATPAQ